MSIDRDTDDTLPSVEDVLGDTYREPQLQLTIIFHPEVSRIGETVPVPRQPSGKPWVLGRLCPDFAAPGVETGKPLQDRYVSRRALAIFRDGEALVLRRAEDASRCRVAGRELTGRVELSRAELDAGVPLFLAHSVVLLLRYAPPACTGRDAVDPSLLGSSSYMRELRGHICRAAASDRDVLVQGETGTGKELVARAIHAGSNRSAAPLVTVNMAAIVPSLAAAELFGTAQGAYTGAGKSRSGFFQQAAGGSLFLDEVGDTPPDIQPLLLRALQQREIQPVGGRVQTVEVRIISATDASLEGVDCSFKSALHHRLGALQITLLPLRRHPEDIGQLLLVFLREALAAEGRAQLLPGPDHDAQEIARWARLFYRALDYHWPGNVRQLRNVATQVACASDTTLVVPAGVEALLAESAAQVEQVSPSQRDVVARSISELDEDEFERAMAANQREVARVARYLGVSRQSIYRRIEASPNHRTAAQIPVEEVQQALRGCGGDYRAAAERLRVSPSGLRARLQGLGQAGAW